MVVERATHGIAMLAVVVVMFVVSSDTFMRYMLNSPIQWAYDVIALYFMVGIAYLPMAVTYTEGRHVNVTLFYHLLPERAKTPVNAVISLLVLGFGAMVLYTSASATLHARAVGDVQLGYTVYAMWLSYLPIAVAFVVFTMRVALSVVLWFLTGNDPFVVMEGEMIE